MRQLSAALHQRVKGFLLAECYSQNKNELIIGFANSKPPHQEFYIKALLDNSFTCLQFPEQFHRSKRNNVDLFSSLIDSQVSAVVQIPNDRSFYIEMNKTEQTFRLLFKMHGNRSNIILLSGNEVVEVFQSQLTKDKHLNLQQLPLNVDFSYENFQQKNENPKKLLPTLGPVPVHYLNEKGFQTLDTSDKWQLFKETVQKLESPNHFFIVLHKDELRFSILPLGQTVKEFDDPIQAINAFFLEFIRDLHLNKEKGMIIKTINKQIVQGENYIQKNQEKLENLESGTSYSQIADIIMANMHQIPEGSRKVILNNFYSNNPIEIRLKQHMSPQKNAELLYRKSKNQKIELAKLKQNISRKEDHLIQLYDHLDTLATLDDVKAIRQYAKDHELQKSKQEMEVSLPFKSFDIGDFKVFVGKNAASNDRMLRSHSYKEDLWLHAKDVAGSHVIIKFQAGKNIPPTVIEKAAGLAAYYSKRKTDSLCPVIVTPRKYVRKSKDMLAGQVIVEKEEVILVEPVEPGQL